MARETFNLLEQIGVQTQGTQQLETLTVAGTITGTGTIIATVTAVGMPNTPKAVTVNVTNGDTAAQTAEKIRQALVIDPDVGGFFIVGGTTTAVTLKRAIAAANDGTMDVSTTLGTATGHTPASSANTTAGVAAGGPAAATKRFSSLQLNMSDTMETKQFRSWGAKSNTISTIHKLWAQGSYTGPLNYVEACYILASLAPYTKSTSGGVTTWDFLPNSAGSDTFELYTVECGDDEIVERFTDVVFRSWEAQFGADDITNSGDIMGKAHDTIFALSAGTSLLAHKPVLRNHIDVYMDSTYAGFGVTKITDALEATWRIGEKFEPKWVLNTTFPSYREPVEKIPDLMMTTVIEANAQGRSLVAEATQNNNPGRFIRIQATGGTIAGSSPTANYLMQIDCFGQVQDIRPQKDYNGVIYAYEMDWTAIHDDSMGRAWRVKIKNGLAAL